MVEPFAVTTTSSASNRLMFLRKVHIYKYFKFWFILGCVFGLNPHLVFAYCFLCSIQSTVDLRLFKALCICIIESFCFPVPTILLF